MAVEQHNGAGTAILYDFLQVKGGAEAVTLGVCEHFKQMDLVTAFVNSTVFTSAPLTPERLHTLTTQTELPGWQTLKSCYSFLHRSQFLARYEQLIFSGSNAPLAVKHSKARQNIYYCHTPPRFVYDLKDYYLSRASFWQKPLLRGLIAYLQPRYERAITQMDVILANSDNVRQRLKKYLNVDAQVLYPPCDIDRFQWLGQQDYFLSTARVEDYKRVELVVRAFMEMPDKPLVVTSGGSQLAQLQALASGHDNIRFTGWCSESQMKTLVGNCLASIYIPIDEDFGMSPVESMGAGKPVIGVDEGGVKETVIDGKTGWLLAKDPQIEDLKAKVQSITVQKAMAMKSDCLEHAEQFHHDRFYQGLAELLKSASN